LFLDEIGKHSEKLMNISIGEALSGANANEVLNRRLPPPASGL
jgi:hypothetical protein